jgi:1,2-dihydroxy-3-keto-5-methylthiopentene dioxygenase
MCAYYFDNLPGDQRLPHGSGRPVSPDHLHKLGVLLWNVLLDTVGGWETEIDKTAEQQGYNHRDNMDITKNGLGDLFETMFEKYFTESSACE